MVFLFFALPRDSAPTRGKYLLRTYKWPTKPMYPATVKVQWLVVPGNIKYYCGRASIPPSYCSATHAVRAGARPSISSTRIVLCIKCKFKFISTRNQTSNNFECRSSCSLQPSNPPSLPRRCTGEARTGTCAHMHGVPSSLCAGSWPLPVAPWPLPHLHRQKSASPGTRYLALPGPKPALPRCNASMDVLGAHRQVCGTSGTPKIAVLPPRGH